MRSYLKRTTELNPKNSRARKVRDLHFYRHRDNLLLGGADAF